MNGFWTCQRVSQGERCGHINANKYRKCQRCLKPRPARRRPAHMKALEEPYEVFLEANGGVNRCGICGKEPPLHRDHEHRGEGKPRGLLCFPCNLQLKHTSTPKWLRAAAAYLERAESLDAKLGELLGGEE